MLSVSRFLQDTEIYKSEKDNNPVISVIMPTYCRGEISLRRAIESVLNQTFTNFEFIIVDDGSKDGTIDILKEYQLKDSRIIIIRHEYNSGLPALRVNEGIMMAKGKYISYQFDDDEYLPDCLETLYREITLIDEECVVYGSCAIQKKNLDGSIVEQLLGDEFSHSKLMNGNFIANNSVLHNKSIFLKSGLYDPHIIIRRFSDYDLWLRMSKYVPFVFVNKQVTKVFAGEKFSLGVDIDYNINKLGNIRKYLEQSRDIQLLEQNIREYQVDELSMYNKEFNNDQSDYLYRFEIVPFKSRVPYYIKNSEFITSNKIIDKKKTIAIVKSDYSTSIDVTIKNFTQRIENFPFNHFFISEKNADLINPNDYDILVLYRTIGEKASKMLQENKKYGKPTIYMMDDNMFTFSELGPDYSYIAPGSTGFNNLIHQVSNSDMLITYNPLITSEGLKYNSTVVEHLTNIPSNFLDESKKENNERIKYAVFSGPVRLNEIEYLWPTLMEFSKKYKDKIEFHFWGIDPSQFGELSCPVYFKPFNHSYETYLRELKYSSFNYHLTPLFGDKSATLSKSPIKFLEGTVAGAVGLFSNVTPYDGIAQDYCIKVDNNQIDWMKKLEYTVNLEEDKRLRMYNKALQLIKNTYTTESQVDALIASFEAAQLISKLNKKKIAYFLHESYLGGATLHLLRHALFARKYGIEIIFCLPFEQRNIMDFVELARTHNISVEFLNYRKYLNVVEPSQSDISCGKEIAKWMLNENVGLAHSVTYIPSVGIACKINGIPHVTSLHQFYENKARKDSLINNKLIDIIHSSSIKYANEWSRNLDVRAHKMACPVDKEFFGFYDNNIERLNRSEKRITILLSGTIQFRKNQLNAIKAISILKERGYDVALDVIGYNTLVEDYSEKCLEVVRNDQLEDVVKFHGFISNPEVFYNNHSDILLCSSIDESMPQTILQAMASGVLVVSTEVGGVKEIIKDNYSGILTENTDELSIANALERAIILNIQRKKDILSNAYNTIKLVADPDYICTELLSLYNLSFNEMKNHELPSILKGSSARHKEISNSKSSFIGIPIEEDLPRIGPGNINVGGPLLKKPRNYEFKAIHNNLSGLKILLGTHSTKCNGVLEATLFSAHNLLTPIRKVELPLSQFVDNQYISLKFEPIDSSENREYIIALQYINGEDDPGKCSVFEHVPNKTILKKIKNKVIKNKTYRLFGYSLYN